jgi:hypothetical protein
MIRIARHRLLALIAVFLTASAGKPGKSCGPAGCNITAARWQILAGFS